MATALRGSPLAGPSVVRASVARRGALQVTNAITREKKEKIVEKIRTHLDGSFVTLGVNFKGLTVQEVQTFRRSLPEDAKFMVAKNTLMSVAVKDDEKWKGLANQDNENGWLFVGENISPTIKTYLEFKEKMEKAGKDMSVRTAVMDGQVLDYQRVERLKDMPTKKELYAKIAIGVKAVPTKIALGVKAVPTKLARAVRLVSELDEDKTKTVADVVGKGPGKASE